MAAINSTRFQRVLGGCLGLILCGLLSWGVEPRSAEAGHGHGCGWGRPLCVAPRAAGWCGVPRGFVGGWGGGFCARPATFGWACGSWRPWSYYGYCVPGWGYAFRGWYGCGPYGFAPWCGPVAPIWGGPVGFAPIVRPRPVIGVAALRLVDAVPRRPVVIGVARAEADWDAPGLTLDDEPALDRVEPVVIAAGTARPLSEGSASATRDVIYPLVRESSVAARRRAAEYVDFGDRLFRDGRYASARAQYQRAASTASDWGVPYLRNAIGAIAMGDYEDAAALARRGAEVDPRLGRREFQLDSIYWDAAAKETHRESLAAAALECPAEPDLVYLLGLLLYLDGDTGRAQKFFAHAVRIGFPADSEAIAAFTPGPVAELAARDERL